MASLAPGPPPSKAASGQQPVVIGGIAGSPAACFLQLSKHGWLGRKPPVCGALSEPPVTTREQWPGWAGGWVEGQPSLFPAPIGERGRLLGGLLPAHLPHPILFSTLLGILSPITGPRKTATSGNVYSMLLGFCSSGRYQNWGREPEKDRHCTGSIMPGTVAKELQSVSPEHLEGSVSLHLTSSGPARGRAQNR